MAAVTRVCSVHVRGALPGLGAGPPRARPDPGERGEQPQNADRPLQPLRPVHVVQPGVQGRAQQGHRGKYSGIKNR